MAAKKIAKKTTTPVPAVADKTPKPTAKKAVAKKAAIRIKKLAVEPVAISIAKKTAAKPSLDDLARAAYLNYRRRVEQSLPGDSHGDWLEAERQFSGQA